MGKKRIIKKSGEVGRQGDAASLAKARKIKRHIAAGVIHIQSTYNNTIITLTDAEGGTVLQSSAGSIGFSGAKKGTPFAAAKVAEFIAEQSKRIGVSEVGIMVKGVGAGREAAIRAIATRGLQINSIRDKTPLPHNGPRAPKPRRV